MTGLSPAPALPIGDAGLRLPRFGRLPRALRIAIVLGGLAVGLWLLGLLMGSAHAEARPQRPAAPPLVQQLDRTSTQLAATAQQATGPVVATVQRSLTETSARVRATASTARRAVTNVTATVTASVTRTVTRTVTEAVDPALTAPLPVITGSAHRPAATHAAARPAAHPAPRTPATRHLIVAPARSARVAAVRPVARTSTLAAVHVNRVAVASTPSRPVAPTVPTPAQPSPATPSSPAASAAPDLSALPLFLVRPATGSVLLAAVSAAHVTGLLAEEPSFSPD